MQPGQQRGGAGPSAETNPSLGVHVLWPWDGPRDFDRLLHSDFALFFCFLYHRIPQWLYLFAEMPACRTEESERARGNRGKNPTPFDSPFP